MSKVREAFRDRESGECDRLTRNRPPQFNEALRLLLEVMMSYSTDGTSTPVLNKLDEKYY